MDIQQWMNSLVPEIQKTIIFGTLTFLVALMLYLRRRHIDKRWLREHGLVLLVYFRNVDWRCRRLQQIAQSNNLIRIRLELCKLQSDIDALDRLLAMWNRRMKFIHLSFGYVKTFDDAHDAFTELQICLLRHILPLMEIISLKVNTAAEANERLNDEFKQYMSYFSGGADRIWGTDPEVLGKEENSKGQSALAEMRSIGLHKRIALLHEKLRLLFEMIGAISISKIKIWNTNEEEGVWFKTQSIQSYPENTNIQSDGILVSIPKQD